MAGDGGRFPHGFQVLPVCGPKLAGAEQAASTQVDHPGGQLEVAPLSGGAKQLDQSHLELWMTVVSIAAFRAELPFDRPAGIACDVEQPVVAEDVVPGDRRLDQVADAVELVSPLEVLVLAILGDNLYGAVEAAVGPLSPGGDRDRLVGGPGDPGRGSTPELPGDSLEPFVYIRVEEGNDQTDLISEGAVLAGTSRGHAQIGEVPGSLEFAEAVGKRVVAVHAKAIGPEASRNGRVSRAER